MHEDTSRALFDVWSRTLSEHPRRFCLLGLGGNRLVLEEHIVLEGNSADACKDWSLHKVMRIRSVALALSVSE